MFRLSIPKLAEVLSFTLGLNDAKKANGEFLDGCPDGTHGLVGADRSIFCVTSGSATQFRNIVSRIERASPSRRRKWSNDRCVVRSYALEQAYRDRIGRAIVSVGRNHPSNKVVCAMFSRNDSNAMFSIDDLAMGHLAIGYVLDLLEPTLRTPNMAIETDDREPRRLQGGGASLLSSRVGRFVSNGRFCLFRTDEPNQHGV